MLAAIVYKNEVRVATKWLEERGVTVKETQAFGFPEHNFITATFVSQCQVIVICTGVQDLSPGFPQPARACCRLYHVRVGHCLFGGTDFVRLLKVVRT